MASQEPARIGCDASSSSKTLQVVSSDGEVFDIDYRVAKQSSMLQMLADGWFRIEIFAFHSSRFFFYSFLGNSTEPIPLPEVNASILRLVSELYSHDWEDDSSV